MTAEEIERDLRETIPEDEIYTWAAELVARVQGVVDMLEEPLEE